MTIQHRQIEMPLQYQMAIRLVIPETRSMSRLDQYHVVYVVYNSQISGEKVGKWSEFMYISIYCKHNGSFRDQVKCLQGEIIYKTMPSDCFVPLLYLQKSSREYSDMRFAENIVKISLCCLFQRLIRPTEEVRSENRFNDYFGFVEEGCAKVIYRLCGRTE